MIEPGILDILRRSGPITGSQFVELARAEVLPLWRLCRRSPHIRRVLVGRRFLRLDRAVEGYARLSPSIRREFLTYTVLGLEEQEDALTRIADEQRRAISGISHEKTNLAREIAVSVFSEVGDGEALAERVCFIIAGDITYDMAHRVPRPEKSTGEMVRGSDLDIIVVAEDDLPADAIKALDNTIFNKKHYLLVHPEYREEIDYIVKDLRRIREQMAFDTFEAMVACKIMDEGQLLYGSRSVFQTVKSLLAKHDIPARLKRLESQAVAERERAERSLLAPEEGISAEQYNHLFFTQEEGEEIY
ncbi:MAG: hypothetical protein KKC51_02445 [Verrucomicrobia bacterium]|nr:hypothetical protein [Verrucomicrobiota bacterium]